jgi:hypothetical protein
MAVRSGCDSSGCVRVLVTSRIAVAMRVGQLINRFLTMTRTRLQGCQHSKATIRHLSCQSLVIAPLAVSSSWCPQYAPQLFGNSRGLADEQNHATPPNIQCKCNHKVDSLSSLREAVRQVALYTRTIALPLIINHQAYPPMIGDFFIGPCKVTLQERPRTDLSGQL